MGEIERLRAQAENKDSLIRLATEEIENLRAENERLTREKEILQAKLKRRLRKALGISEQDGAEENLQEETSISSEPDKPEHKRGAPKGHRGATRRKPDHVDRVVDVYTEKCPRCGGTELTPAGEISEHMQEDIIIPVVLSVLFRHHHAYCPICKSVVCEFGGEELKGAYIGPVAKATAGFFRYSVKLSYGTVRRIIKGLFGLDVTESALVGFDNSLCERGLPLYEVLKEKLRYSDVAYTDETGWRKRRERLWLWVMTNPEMALYHIDSSRGSKVPRAFLGEEYPGIIVSDFFSAYGPLVAKGKAKCAAHLMRTARDLKEDLPKDVRVQDFCTDLLEIMKSGIDAYKAFHCDTITRVELACRKEEISGRMSRLGETKQKNKDAENLRKRIVKYHDEILTFLDNPSIEPTNNRAERQLRPNVIMRKLTFGNRSDQGLRNHCVIMSLLETAKLNSRDPRMLLLHLVRNGVNRNALRMMLGSARARAP